MRIRTSIAFFFFGLLSLSLATTEDITRFRISDVTYSIKGSTREFPLSQKVDIDRDRIFDSESALRAYVSDLEIRLRNQRVFESASVDIDIAPATDGVAPVKLTVKTVDTWNIIALPYPKFDSNNGYQIKLKLKNYNFFGSMEEMNWDAIFNIDNNGDKDLETNFDFSIPFELKGYAAKWSIVSSLIIPFNEVPEYNLTTGFDFTLPTSFADMHIGVKQGMSINDRDDDDKIVDDRFFLTETAYVNLPYTLHEFEYVGKLQWTPEISINQNWNMNGIKDPDLTGPDFTVKHSLSLGRTDWIGNFRKGFNLSVSNEYVYDIYQKSGWEISVSGEAAGYATFFDRIGINSRITGFHDFFDEVEDDAGDKLRGILDSRITTNSMVTFNFDLPVRIMRVDFEEITGVSWTRYISFDMHASPFFDMALTHDQVTDRYFSLKDGWYSGGLEIIVYPFKMRSIYARASVGFDLSEVAKSGKLTGNATRDGESVHEYFVGIGLAY